MFYDRHDAGERLAQRLADYRGRKDAIVLAIPRGGVVIGRVVADVLNLELDIILTKKIGHPNSPEYAIGVVNLSRELIDEDVVARDEIPREYIQREISRIRKLLRRRYDEYRGGRAPIALKDKIVILTDDGIATGKTMIAAVRIARDEQARKIVVAVPVAPPHAVAELEQSAEEVICLMAPENFFAIGQFYDDFKQVSDEEAIEMLQGGSKVPSRKGD